MSALITNIDWQRNTKDFTYDSFNRNHVVYFSGDQEITNSAAPEYKGDADAANPEELLGAAIGSCHMLTFLAIASKQGYVVENYECKNEAILGKNDEGKTVVTDVHLYPLTVFSGDKKPTQEQLKTLHDKAHANCFIAQSVKTKVSVHL